jgi:hypothetical protein
VKRVVLFHLSSIKDGNVVEGPSISIEYVSFDDSQWVGTLEPLSGHQGPQGIADPNWQILRPSDGWRGSDDKIYYLAKDRSRWTANPEAHQSTLNNDGVWFRLNHTGPDGNSHPQDHPCYIEFLAWDGTHWRADLPNMPYSQLNQGIHPTFILSKIP